MPKHRKMPKAIGYQARRADREIRDARATVDLLGNRLDEVDKLHKEVEAKKQDLADEVEKYRGDYNDFVGIEGGFVGGEGPATARTGKIPTRPRKVREPLESWRHAPDDASRRFTVHIDESGKGEAAEAATLLLAIPWELARRVRCSTPSPSSAPSPS
jgi:hypothetical protein